jgi:hypothetical protein
MISLRVEQDYHGPTIIEIEALLDLSEEPIEVKWSNTEHEVAIANRYRDRNLTLIVRDLLARVRAANAVGGSYALPADLVESAMTALTSVDGDWRGFVEKVGGEIAFTAVAQDYANQFRRGVSEDRSLRKVLVACLFNEVSTEDMGALLALRRKRL